MAAIELAEREQVERGRQQSEPGGQAHRVHVERLRSGGDVAPLAQELLQSAGELRLAGAVVVQQPAQRRHAIEAGT